MQKKEQEYVQKTFDEVAAKYDDIPFFKISAQYIVELIHKETKQENLEILDVACGTGNVVLECASSFRNALFDAVDISEGMLGKAKANAQEKKLKNINFQLQDVTKLYLKKKYNIITCSYALFFLPKAHSVLKNLMLLLKKDGIVIFTSFTNKAFKPSSDILLDLLEKHGSISAKEYKSEKWENLKCEEDIKHLCKMANIENISIKSKAIRYGMSIDEWWELFNNTGFKGMLMELTPEHYGEVRYEFYEAMFKKADMDGEVELIADSYFVLLKE